MNGSKPQPAEIISHTPYFGIGRGDIPPPSHLYVIPEDVLRLRVYNSVVGVRVDIAWRTLTPEGRIVTSIKTIFPASDRSLVDAEFPMAEGFLLSVGVFSDTVASRRGQTYAQVYLVRRQADADSNAPVLIGDYIVAGQAIGWPANLPRSSVDGPGMIRAITGTNPAAGVEISETVPTNARWQLRSIFMTLTTAVAVANRQVAITIDDGANNVLVTYSASVQAASLVNSYCVADFGTFQAAILTQHFIPLPMPFLLFQGWRIKTVTNSLQAADDWGAPILNVEEWIED